MGPGVTRGAGAAGLAVAPCQTWVPELPPAAGDRALLPQPTFALTCICISYLTLQMGNTSNASVFISTLSEREDLIFGTLYLVFGKERWAVLAMSLLQQPRCLPETFQPSAVTDAPRCGHSLAE